MKKISVILPCYNTEKFLDVCINSLIIQTAENFEIIAVNDGSTDSTPKILENYSKFDKRIKIINKENGGLSSARNEGMNHAKGEYIVFVDSDDWLAPDFLEKMYFNIKKNKSDYCISNSYVINNINGEIAYFLHMDEKFYAPYLKDGCFKEENMPPFIWSIISPCAWGKMYRKDFIKNFKFEEGLIFEDMPYHSECYLNAEKISLVFESLYFYRQQSQASIINTQANKNGDIYKIYDLIEKIFIRTKKYEKYKTELMLKKIQDCTYRMVLAPMITKEEMFEKFKKTFNLNYNSIELEILEKTNAFYHMKNIIKMNFREYLEYEYRVLRK